MKHFSYWRSSAAYRVRIALALKDVAHEKVFVHLVKGGGEQYNAEYKALNPQCLVPSLVLDDGAVLTQSMAILEYIEEKYSYPALLPSDASDRARVRALCNVVACDIHPLNNLRVLTYLRNDIGIEEEAKTAWYRHWIEIGFNAVEELLCRADGEGPYCFGGEPTLADVCLIPQVYNAKRFEVDLSPYSKIMKVDATCANHEAFSAAHPSAQEDSES